MTGQEFEAQLGYMATAWLPARDIVKAGLDKRLDVDPSGQILVLQQVRLAYRTVTNKLTRPQAAPWKDHLFLLETSLSLPAPILYILYPEGDEPGSRWRIQCVPVDSDSFENRKSMPEAWRGVRDEELSKVSGIPGCIFCHASGFIGGNETYEGSLEMARQSLKA